MGEAVDAAVALLRTAGLAEPRREAESLLAFLLQTDRGGVVAHRPDPLPAASALRFAELARRRAAREPIQYLTGESEFLGLPFLVTQDVLVPRPETEELVERALGWDLPSGATVYDFGTGSGCIAVSLAVRRPDLRVVAVERSLTAIEIARANAARHGAADRVELVQADFGRLPAERDGTAHAIVSNPPYVSESEWAALAPEVRDYEPKEALVPGPAGDEAYWVVAQAARRLLAPRGWLAVELGWKSLAGASRAFEAAGLSNLRSFDDVRGIRRILRGDAAAA